MIYTELKKKSPEHMWRILIIGTIGATVSYVIAGMFGYATFA
jgi:amino acid permease